MIQNQLIRDTLSGLWTMAKVVVPLILIFSTSFIHFLLPFAIIFLLVLLVLANFIGEDIRRSREFQQWLEEHKREMDRQMKEHEEQFKKDNANVN